MESSLWIPIIGGFFGIIGSIVAGYYAVRQQTIKKDISVNAEKVESTKDLTKIAFDSLQNQVKTLTGELKTRATEMIQIRDEVAKIRQQFTNCQDDKNELNQKLTDMKIELDFATAQFKSYRNHQTLRNKALKAIDPETDKKITQYMLDHVGDNMSTA